AVLGRVQINAGIGPSLDEKLAAEIEVLVLAGGAQPRGVAGAWVHHDIAVAHIKGGLGPVLHGPAGQRPAVEQRDHSRFVAGLWRGQQKTRRTCGRKKIASLHASISLIASPPKSVSFS